MTPCLRWAISIKDWNPPDPEWQRLLSLVSPDERAEVLTFLKQDDQKRALVSRLAQRACISKVLGIPWQQVSIGRTKGRRPFAVNAVNKPHAPNFNYNVSHDGDYVVLASEPLCLVGCDVSAPRTITNTRGKTGKEWLNAFQKQLTVAEWNVVYAAGSNDVALEAAFRQFWCLKEALAKARGDGLAFDMSQAEFTIGPRGRGVLTASVNLEGRPQSQWRFFLQELGQTGHWVGVARAPTAAVIDAHGVFKSTFQQPSLSETELQAALDAHNPEFEELAVRDLLPGPHG